MSCFCRHINRHFKLYFCPYISCKFSKGKGLGIKEALFRHKKRVYSFL
jgi:hypothetical protein